MEQLMTFETLRNFAYVNDSVCAKPIRGMVLSFFGLNGREMYDEDTEEGIFYGRQGILYVIPYYNPWCWMNRQAVDYTNEVIDVLAAHYALPDNLPIVSTGGSMGGLSALTYMVYARRTPVACVANCPVCDLPYHFTERPDLPRTLYSAFFGYEGTMQDALESASPLHLAKKMPPADYYIFHCEEDRAVNLQMHSEKLVDALKALRPVTFHTVPGRGHCDLPPEMRDLYRACAVKAIEAATP